MKENVFRVVHLFLLTVIAAGVCAVAWWIYSVPRVSDLQGGDEKVIMRRPAVFAH